jgi:(E)-4-hydroxy-3-methylbut-2-enyl-diphosphate synthase
MRIPDYKSREIKIGNIPVGGDHPIVIQSMTSTKTMDTEATVSQSIRMIEAGCQMVRITAPGMKEAQHLAVIKAELMKRGYDVPLIADIHYSPKAAEVAASIVEKVRINPGNYIDRKRGKVSFSETVYQAEIEKIKERIQPLIEKSIILHYGLAVIMVHYQNGFFSNMVIHLKGWLNQPWNLSAYAKASIFIKSFFP